VNSLPSALLTRDDLASLTDALVIPWFETGEGIAVFEKMRSHSRLRAGDGWVTGTSETRWDFSGSGQHRGYASSNESDNAWDVLMTRHVVPFEVAREVAFQKYIPTPEDLTKLDNGVLVRDGVAVLGPAHPTIAYRYPSRNDDARTVVAAALPESGFLPSTGYVHTLRQPVETPGAVVLALLGFLNTRVCDWWARRLVDRHVTAPVMNGLPLPDWSPSQIRRAADLVSSLLARANVTRLAGGIVVDDVLAAGVASTDDLLLELERLAFDGFALTEAEASVVMDDFSSRGLPAEMRDRLLASYESEE
jgi:hypothetical protein